VVSVFPALVFSTSAYAQAEEVAKPDPVVEARLKALGEELRCLVCQNQTIADSNASLAVDLRREARALIKQGKSDAEVVDYMTARYGDFVLYRPPMRATTLLLWFGPALMLAVVFLAAYGIARGTAGLMLAGVVLLAAGFFLGYRMEISATLADRVRMWQAPWDNVARGGDHSISSIAAISTVRGVRGMSMPARAYS